MATDRGIWVEGERELYMNMQRVMGENLAAARKGLQEAGLDIIADAKDNLKKNRSVATGLLRASGKVQKIQGDPDAIDVGFFSKKSKGYAFFVEYGRRSGKMPPVDEIFAYLKKTRSRHNLKANLKIINARARKPKTAADYLYKVAWAVAKAIGKRGTRPHPFFAPAVKKNEKKVADAIAKAIQEDIK